jgi:CheY-like chemotaxis protein
MIPAHPHSFLLIEDNTADADLIQRVLKKIDPAIHIYLARDGEEALQILENWSGKIPSPMVILLDLKLPKVDGLEVLKAVKSDKRLKALPIIVLTSSSQLVDVQEAYLLGANSYILKAIDFDEFSNALELIYKYWCKLNVFPF